MQLIPTTNDGLRIWFTHSYTWCLGLDDLEISKAGQKKAYNKDMVQYTWMYINVSYAWYNTMKMSSEECLVLFGATNRPVDPGYQCPNH